MVLRKRSMNMAISFDRMSAFFLLLFLFFFCSLTKAIRFFLMAPIYGVLIFCERVSLTFCRFMDFVFLHLESVNFNVRHSFIVSAGSRACVGRVHDTLNVPICPNEWIWHMQCWLHVQSMKNTMYPLINLYGLLFFRHNKTHRWIFFFVRIYRSFRSICVPILMLYMYGAQAHITF